MGESEILQGKKSWIGLVAIVVGLLLRVFGIGECSPADAACVPAETIVQMLMAALDQILVAAGAIVTAYGVLRKQLRERALKAEVAALKAPEGG